VKDEEMRVHFTSVTPVLIVETVEPTRSFFCDRLGFVAVTDVVQAGALGFSLVRRDDVELMIQSDASLRADAGENYVPGPYKASIYIDVDDVEELVPEVADVDVVLPLRRTPYGMHEIGVREPGGNIVVFASHLPE
jgi:catechol 2,3-dioxygenase-like lactoylglutathione lyase family enzyme